MVGDNIKKIRKLKNLGLNELARKSHISGSYLSNLEKGIKDNPSIETLASLAKVLDVSIGELYDGDLSIYGILKEALIVPESVEIKTVPTEFINANEARAYVNMHQIFGAHGFNANKLDDNEILEFANELLKQMEMVSFKYKK